MKNIYKLFLILTIFVSLYFSCKNDTNIKIYKRKPTSKELENVKVVFMNNDEEKNIDSVKSSDYWCAEVRVYLNCDGYNDTHHINCGCWFNSEEEAKSVAKYEGNKYRTYGCKNDGINIWVYRK